jgi:hypothetical protein
MTKSSAGRPGLSGACENGRKLGGEGATAVLAAAGQAARGPGRGQQRIIRIFRHIDRAN